MIATGKLKELRKLSVENSRLPLLNNIRSKKKTRLTSLAMGNPTGFCFHRCQVKASPGCDFGTRFFYTWQALIGRGIFKR